MRRSFSLLVSLLLLSSAGCGDPCDGYCAAAVDRLIECKILKDSDPVRSSEIEACLSATKQQQADSASCDAAKATFESFTCGQLYVEFCGSPDPNVICTEPVVCDDKKECTTDNCPANDLPTHIPEFEGTPCSYGFCDGAGACVQCVADSTCPLTGKEPCVVRACIDHYCSETPAPGGTSCDDGDACTQNDACENGACQSGAPVVCNPADDCHSAGLCQPSGACTTPLLCTGSAVCQGGSCAAPACGGALSFSPAVNVTRVLGVDDVVTADLDGDHDADLAMTEPGGDAMFARTLGNQGNGSYVSIAAYNLGVIQAGTSGSQIVARDFDGDGRMDLAGVVLTTGSVVVLRNQGQGQLDNPATYSIGMLAGGLDAADVDGDGSDDLVVPGPSDNEVTVLLHIVGTAFDDGVTYPIGTTGGGIAIADVDGDGAPDIVACNNVASTVSVLHNQGNGTFAAPAPFPASANARRVAAGDLNGDSRPDLVTLSPDVGLASVLVNNGDGTFSAPVSLPLVGGGTRHELVDLDRDGDLDLLVLYGDQVQLFRNESGSLTFTDQIWLQFQAYGIATGDLDGNGYPDIVGYGSDLKVVYTSCGP